MVKHALIRLVATGRIPVIETEENDEIKKAERPDHPRT